MISALNNFLCKKKITNDNGVASMNIYHPRCWFLPLYRNLDLLLISITDPSLSVEKYFWDESFGFLAKIVRFSNEVLQDVVEISNSH